MRGHEAALARRSPSRRLRRLGRQQESPNFDQEKWAHLGSNQGPLACEASALPLSYAPEEAQNVAGKRELLSSDRGAAAISGLCASREQDEVALSRSGPSEPRVEAPGQADVNGRARDCDHRDHPPEARRSDVVRSHDDDHEAYDGRGEHIHA
jgi:hypothetical protein